MWLRFVKRYELRSIPQATVSYRIRAGQQNLGAPTAGQATRAALEHYLILRRFFDDCPPELFREAFADRLRHTADSSAEALAYEQALLFLDSDRPLLRLVGIERLYGLLSDPATAHRLAERYDVTPTRFVEQLKQIDVLNLFPPLDTELYIDTGGGFNEAEKCIAHTRLGEPEFRLSFDLRPYSNIRELRWDPVKLRFCRLRLDEIALHEGTETQLLDPATCAMNGHRMADGRYEFETAVPIMFLPVAGRPDRLTVRGRLEVFDTDIALSRQYAEIMALEQAAREREYALQVRDHELAVCRHELEVSEDRRRVREHELEVCRQQLHAHQEALGDARRVLQSILDSRGYKLLQKARSAARFVARRRAG
jgi:hypothetical protein